MNLVRKLVFIVLIVAALPSPAATRRAIGQKPVARPAAPERVVTLDVSDEDVRLILKSMQSQCGVKNLVIDPQVQGRGTFFLRRLPCTAAFKVVFETMGLAGDAADRSLIAVRARR